MNGSFETVVVSAQAAFCVLETAAMFAVIVAVAETNRYHYEYRLFSLIASLYVPIDFFHCIQIKHLIEYICTRFKYSINFTSYSIQNHNNVHKSLCVCVFCFFFSIGLNLYGFSYRKVWFVKV